MSHDDVHDLLPEYVFGTLEPALRVEVERHLDGCADCRALLAEHARVLDALGRGVEQTAPPPDLRARVLRAAAAAAPATDARRAPVAATRVPAWMLAAAAVLLSVLAGWSLLTLKTERARLEAQAAEQQRSIAVLASDDLVRFELRGDAAVSRGARARAFWSHRHGMVFTADGLAPVPRGRTYQLWVISGGKPISAGVFATTPDGRARIVAATPQSLTQVDAVAITVEPEGGLSAPSTTPILAGGPAAD